MVYYISVSVRKRRAETRRYKMSRAEGSLKKSEPGA
jgi:hypothetical protein